MKETMKSKGTIIMTKELLNINTIVVDREDLHWNGNIEKNLQLNTIYSSSNYNGFDREIVAIKIAENVKLVEVEDGVENEFFNQEILIEEENGIVTIKYHKCIVVSEIPKQTATTSYQSARSIKHYLGK